MLSDRLRMHRGPSPSAGEHRWDSYPAPLRRALRFLQGLSPQWRDAFLYGCSALFAGLTGLVAGIPLYRQWGQMAFGPYVAAAGLMAVVGWRMGIGTRARRPGPRR